VVNAADLNPFANLNLGSKMGSMGAILLVILIAVVILAMIGFLVYITVIKKQYWIKIHVFRLIGNVPTRIAIYQAKEIPFGMAGDKLWKVSKGLLKIKAVKWLPVGAIQTAPREFWYFVREDNEWINFSMDDLNDIQKKAGVKFTQEDMRLQRLATERLLEQRLMNKTFWEKWGTVVMTLIFFLVISVCMVIIFYQFSKTQDRQLQIENVQLETSQILLRVFGEGFISEAKNQTGGGNEGLIPV